MAKEEVGVTLQRKAEQVRHNAEILVNEIRDFQIIEKYSLNKLRNIELTPIQEEKLKRYQFIYSELSTGKYKDAEIIQSVITMFKLKPRQASEDMRYAKELYPKVFQINKQFEVHQQLQINRDMQRRAMELNNIDAFAKLEKSRTDLLKLIPDEPDNPADMFEGHTIVAMFDPALIGAPPVDMKEVLTVLNAKRGNKQIKVDMFEELNYEETTSE